jgi:prepilin-type N-terminal cleavage/methylation domain-containing protein
MKNHQLAGRRGSTVEARHNIIAPLFSRLRPSTLDPRLAFTLVELLIVIAIIGTLAAFTIPVMRSVKRLQYIKHATAERALLETAIQRYHDAYGFYPPSNPNYNPGNPATWTQAMFSPLYFELLGTTNNNGIYQTLDGSAFISANPATMTNGFGVGGFINCSKVGSSEDAPAAKNFLPDLKTKQFGSNITNNGIPVTLLLGSVGGPDQNYEPILNAPNINPWRYVSPGVNNPNSYDLWMQLSINGQTNLICNWSGQVQINNPLP